MTDKEEKRMVKGLMLMDYIKLIRTAKDIQWDKYLTEEDFETITGRIVPMGWYSFETYRNCGKAVLTEIAKGDMNIVKQFGRSFMRNIIDNVYTFLGKTNGVFEGFQGLDNIGSRFFSFAYPKFEQVGEKSLRVTIVDAPGDELLEALAWQLIGSYEFLIEHYGGQEVEIDWIKKQWDGDECVSFNLNWQ